MTDTSSRTAGATSRTTDATYWIAFDYGLKRIGVAIGQTLTASAREQPPLNARDGTPDWGQIERLLAEWAIRHAIVGLPLNMDGSDSAFTQRARKFAQRLSGRFGLDVRLVDERLTSFDAKGIALAAGHKGHWAQDPIDSLAARLLLDGFLNDPTSSERVK
jgi:putative holliday junction resolvase